MGILSLARIALNCSSRSLLSPIRNHATARWAPSITGHTATRRRVAKSSRITDSGSPSLQAFWRIPDSHTISSLTSSGPVAASPIGAMTSMVFARGSNPCWINSRTNSFTRMLFTCRSSTIVRSVSTEVHTGMPPFTIRTIAPLCALTVVSHIHLQRDRTCTETAREKHRQNEYRKGRERERGGLGARKRRKETVVERERQRERKRKRARERQIERER